MRFWWDRLNYVGYDEWFKSNSFKYRKDYIPIKFVFDSSVFKNFRKDPVLSFLLWSIKDDKFLNLYYNQFYYNIEKQNVKYASDTEITFFENENEDDEYLFGEQNKYNSFLSKFFLLREKFFPWFNEVELDPFEKKKRRAEKKFISQSLYSVLNMMFRVYFPFYGLIYAHIRNLHYHHL